MWAFGKKAFVPGSEDDHIILTGNTFGKDYRSKSVDRLSELFQTSLFSQHVFIRLSDLVISHLFFKDLSGSDYHC